MSENTTPTQAPEVIERGKVDPRTGEIVTIKTRPALTVPSKKEITSINKVAGRNPAAANLRDHPEFSGQEFIVVDAKFGHGDTGEFVVATGFLHPPAREANEEDLTVIITGADNVYQRLAVAFAENAFPVAGMLRKSGRAWFMD